MTATLKDILATRPPRETSGSLAANRFDFQKDWVICHILDLHADNDDYLVICDYHEDVIVLDKEEAPEGASFYQIKTLKGKNWTLNRLLSKAKTKAKKGGIESILGKLYGNYCLAPKFTSSLHFVSNAPYDIKLSTGKSSFDYRTIACVQLTSAEVKKIIMGLNRETDTTCSLPQTPPLYFEVTPLGIDGHETFAKGRLLEYFEKIDPGKSHPVAPAYRVLLEEVRRRTNHEGQIADFEEIKMRKGIGRSTVEKMLSAFVSKIDLAQAWQEIAQRLTVEGVPPIAMRKLKNEWDLYEVKRMDPVNESLQKLREQISSISKTVIEAASDTTLNDLCELVLSQIGETGLYTGNYIRAMTLMETYENLKLPQIDTKSEEKN